MNLINQVIGNRFADEALYRNTENEQQVVSNSPLSPSDCRFDQNPSLDRKELLVKKILGQRALCFDPNDPKPKLLYLMGKYDPSRSLIIKSYMNVDDVLQEYEGSTDPRSVKTYFSIKAFQQRARQGDQQAIDELKTLQTTDRRGADRLLKSLNKIYDLRFKIIYTNRQLCEEIEAASKIGNFKSLIINAHGGYNVLYISDSQLLVQDPLNKNRLMDYNAPGEDERDHTLFNLNEKCFSGLDANGTITLLACETGASENSLASTISKVSQRDVWAPRRNITRLGIELSIPTFKSIDGTSDDACLFSPDGSMRCVEKEAAIFSVKHYITILFLSVAMSFCFYKYVAKPLRR
jgi:hypothetical protein